MSFVALSTNCSRKTRNSKLAKRSQKGLEQVIFNSGGFNLKRYSVNFYTFYYKLLLNRIASLFFYGLP